MDRKKVLLIATFVAAALLVVGALTKSWLTFADSMGSTSITAKVGLREMEFCMTDKDDDDDDEHGSFGGGGAQKCDGGSLNKTFNSHEDGESDRDDDHAKRYPTFVMFGNLTFYVSLAAAALLIAAGIMSMNAKDGKRHPIMNIAGGVAGAAGLCALIFFFSKPSGGGPNLSPGFSFFMGVIGGVGGAVSCFVSPNAALGAVSAMSGLPGMPHMPSVPSVPGMPGGYPQMPQAPGMPGGYPQMPQAPGMPGGYPGAVPPPPQAAPPPPAPQAGPVCPRCASPATWVGQYQRWFCQRCGSYL